MQRACVIFSITITIAEHNRTKEYELLEGLDITMFLKPSFRA